MFNMTELKIHTFWVFLNMYFNKADKMKHALTKIINWIKMAPAEKRREKSDIFKYKKQKMFNKINWTSFVRLQKWNGNTH